MTSEQKSERRSEMIEWVFAAISTIVVLGLMGFFLFETLTATSGPPKFETSILASYETEEGLSLVVQVGNLGHEPAADVTVRAVAGQGEPSDVTIDYIASGSTGQATFNLPGPITSANDVTLRVTGFTRP